MRLYGGLKSVIAAWAMASYWSVVGCGMFMVSTSLSTMNCNNGFAKGNRFNLQTVIMDSSRYWFF